MDDMWKMFEKGQRSANPYALEDHVNELIHMTKPSRNQGMEGMA